MSLETLAWANTQICGDVTTKAVLREIANWSRPDGYCEFRSIKDIANVTEASGRSVQRALKKLEAPRSAGGLGLIKRVPRQREDGSQASNGFELVGYIYHGDKVSPPHDKLSPHRDSMSPAPRQIVTTRGDNLSPLIKTTNLEFKNTPLTPQQAGGRKIRKSIPESWTVPAIGALPDNARACAEMWLDKAYAAQAEAFEQFHRGSGSRRADWDALWAAWVIKNHEAVMRCHKAGVTPPAPLAKAGEHFLPKSKPPSAAKAREDHRSTELHDVLGEAVGAAVHQAWFEPAALLFEDDCLIVAAPSDFHKSMIEDRWSDALGAALATLGIGVDAIKFQTIAPAKNRKTRK